MLDAKKQECVGLYLYGAGAMARDDNTLGILTGRGSSEPHFCLSCPKRAECEDEHERRVRRIQPQATERFDRMMKRAVRKGFPPTLAAVFLGTRGLDPYMLVSVENFTRGHADRGQISGPLAG